MAQNFYGLMGVNSYMERRNNETLKETEYTFASKLQSVSSIINPDYMNSQDLIHLVNKYC